MTAVDLLPCPFCGEDAEFEFDVHEDNHRTPRDFWHVRVRCRECEVSQDWLQYGRMECRNRDQPEKADAMAQATMAWNRRTPSSQPPEPGSRRVEHREITDHEGRTVDHPDYVPGCDISGRCKVSDEDERSGTRMAMCILCGGERWRDHPRPRNWGVWDGVGPEPGSTLQSGSGRVKQLVWPENTTGPGSLYEGTGGLIRYMIKQGSGFQFTTPGEKWSRSFDRYEDAKAAAQADHEARVLAQFEPGSGAMSVVEAIDVLMNTPLEVSLAGNVRRVTEAVTEYLRRTGGLPPPAALTGEAG